MDSWVTVEGETHWGGHLYLWVLLGGELCPLRGQLHSCIIWGRLRSWGWHQGT